MGRLDIAKKIAEHTFNEIPMEIASVDFVIEDSIYLDTSLLEPINFVTCERTSNQSFELSWNMMPTLGEWSGSYSAVEFVSEFYRRLRRQYPVRFLNHEERGFVGDDLVLRLEVQPTSLQSTIEAEFLLHEERIQGILVKR